MYEIHCQTTEGLQIKLEKMGSTLAAQPRLQPLRMVHDKVKLSNKLARYVQESVSQTVYYDNNTLPHRVRRIRRKLAPLGLFNGH